MSQKKIYNLDTATLIFNSPEEAETGYATRSAKLYSYEDGPIDEYGDPLYLEEIRYFGNNSENTISDLQNVTLIFGTDNDATEVSAYLFSYDVAPSDSNGDALYLEEIIINN